MKSRRARQRTEYDRPLRARASAPAPAQRALWLRSREPAGCCADEHAHHRSEPHLHAMGPHNARCYRNVVQGTCPVHSSMRRQWSPSSTKRAVTVTALPPGAPLEVLHVAVDFRPHASCTHKHSHTCTLTARRSRTACTRSECCDVAHRPAIQSGILVLSSLAFEIAGQIHLLTDGRGVNAWDLAGAGVSLRQ